MPQAAAAAFAFIGSTVTTIGTAVAGAVSAIPGLAAVGHGLAHAAAGFGASIAAGGVSGALALARGVSTALTVVSLFTGTPQIGANAGQASFADLVVDPNDGIPYAMGRTGVAGRLRVQVSSNDTPHSWRHWVVALSGAGPINAIESFSIGGEEITFASTSATTAPYTGKLKMTTTLGPVSGWSLAQPTDSGVVPELAGADRKATGYAMARLAFKADPNVYPGGLIDRPLFVIEGVTAFDPREWTGYPGGSGTQDPADESTWGYSDNPYLHALTWALGRRQNGKLIMGLGAPIEAIRLAQFVEGANVAEANGWTISGGVTSRDSKFEVLAALLQAGCGVPIIEGPFIGCRVETPRVAIADLTAADLMGEFHVPERTPRRLRVNQVVPLYTSEAHDWQQVAAQAFKVDAYIAEEGLRSKEIGYPLVGGEGAATQATQLAAYAVYNTHETGGISLTLGQRWSGYQPGDQVTATIDELGLAVDLVIERIDPDPQSGLVSVSFRTETSGKHAVALALTGAAAPAPAMTRPDPRSVAAPQVGYWSVEAGTAITGAYGSPFLKVTGSKADNTAVEEVIVEYRDAGASGAWQSMPPPIAHDAGAMETVVFGLPTGSIWDVSVRYRKRTVHSDRLVFEDIEVGALVGPGIGGGGGDGTPPDGTLLFQRFTPGSGAFEVPFDGEVDIVLWGGGATSLPDYYEYDPKTGEPTVHLPAFGGGGGGKAVAVNRAVLAGDIISFTIGDGGVTSFDGGASTCSCAAASPAISLTANGGVAGDYAGAGAGGAASGGDSNVTGNAGGAVNDWDGGAASPFTGSPADQTTPGASGVKVGDASSAPHNGANYGQPGGIKILFNN